MIYRRLLLPLIAVLTLVGPVAYADDQMSAVLTGDQIALIRENCSSVQAAMMRLHANDALARVHLGQGYETISARLMTPMNTRVVIEKYEGSALIRTAADFNLRLDQFRNEYQRYDQTITKIIQMKCESDPKGFYSSIEQGRMYRAEVRNSVVTLGNLIGQYRTQVDELRTSVIGKTTETTR
ncbi:MAG: hypothetical protein WBP22_05980 [Candidatus Saccharimonas sp.]